MLITQNKNLLCLIVCGCLAGAFAYSAEPEPFLAAERKRQEEREAAQRQVLQQRSDVRLLAGAKAHVA